MAEVSTKRIQSIDLLRGIVMVLMALDHTRDYFSNFQHNPLDMEHGNAAMFLTRWITHYCAPVFVFLSGTSAFLSMQKGISKREASLFLLKRGIWLILLEVTVVRFGWMFNINYQMVFVQVIWAIGWSMVFLSGLIWLPKRMILGLSLAIIFGHNLLDGIRSSDTTGNPIWWRILHEQGGGMLGDVRYFVAYPLIPWIAVMSAGYCFGTIFRLEEKKRSKYLYLIGSVAIALFILLRATGFYGNPEPWIRKNEWWKSALTFLDCEKYPPSLLYLLMTLGPAILLMPVLEKARGAVTNFFKVFGKVPMFYYLLHIYLIHALQLVSGLALGFPLSYFTSGSFGAGENWGFGLPVVYLVWLIVIGILYFPCRWFMQLKQRRKDAWLRYL